MNNLLGDNPIRTIIKLALMSLVVGFVLNILHITPIGLFEYLVEKIAYIIETSFGNLETVIGYIATGAVIVIPLWLLKRSSDKKHEEKLRNRFSDRD